MTNGITGFIARFHKFSKKEEGRSFSGAPPLSMNY